MVSKVYQNRIKNDIKEIVDKSNEIEEIKHKGLRGDFREKTIGKIFKKYLSPDWDIGAGEIIDSRGNTSNETDLIIFNRYNVPPIFFDGNSGSFPIETCAYAFEIKTTSNATEIKTTIEKFQNLKSLQSASTKPLTVYLAFDTDYMQKQRETIKKY